MLISIPPRHTIRCMALQETIMDFCGHLRAVLQAETGCVGLSCSRRPGAVANSLLLLGAYLILERGYTTSKAGKRWDGR